MVKLSDKRHRRKRKNLHDGKNVKCPFGATKICFGNRQVSLQAD
jgi:hypothetical protein